MVATTPPTKAKERRMTEQEYIDATDLANLRAVQLILHPVADGRGLRGASAAIQKVIFDLEDIVKTEEPTDGND